MTELLKLIIRSEYVLTPSIIKNIFEVSEDDDSIDNPNTELNHNLKHILKINKVKGDKSKFKQQRYNLVRLLLSYYTNSEIGPILGGTIHSAAAITRSFNKEVTKHGRDKRDYIKDTK